MYRFHKINWPHCLSHKVYDVIEKGHPKRWLKQNAIRFFWGLGADIPQAIERAQSKDQEWWIVDIGYITEDIKRYPIPKILDRDKTYFRFSKYGLHNDLAHIINDRTRFDELTEKEIGHTKLFKNFIEKPINEDGHILLAPSSTTVCKHLYNMSQDQWINIAINEIRKYTDREIRFRNKPRPNNEWWNTDIKDDLKDAYCLVTNMSLSTIDALCLGVPIICDDRNVCSTLVTSDFSSINNLQTVDKEQLEKILIRMANCQFTLREIKHGKANKVLSQSYNNGN